MVANYLVRELPETLTYRNDLSEKAAEYRRGGRSRRDGFLFPDDQQVGSGWATDIAGRALAVPRGVRRLDCPVGPGVIFARLVAFMGMVLAIYAFCGAYIYYLHESSLLTRPIPLLRLLGLVVVTCGFCKFTASDPMRAEMVPMLVAAMVMTISFGRQMTILVTTCIALMITLALGLNLVELVTLCSGCCAAALLVGRIRNRSKLIYVGLVSGAIVALTHLGVDTLIGRMGSVLPLAADAETIVLSSRWTALLGSLLTEALRVGAFAVMAAALVAGSLPIIEKLFGVQTDLSLLELGDASHALLRQLAQRAPGTYNHSINVAAIAEAAADSIGAHGLLTRVGAYFHDIGKMFKPYCREPEAGGVPRCAGHGTWSARPRQGWCRSVRQHHLRGGS